MRKVLLALLALGAVSASPLQAAPVIGPAPMVGEAPQALPVQYYNNGFRYRQQLRQDRFIARQQRREFRHAQRPYYRPYGYARPGYRQFGYSLPRY